jgi:prepilin-type N-terminal cleavage/methylation domain-containing protein
MTKHISSLYHRGFTLMEIMVVLAIMGILAAVAVPLYRDYMVRAEVMGAFEFAESMRTKVMVDDSDGLIKGNGILYEAPTTGDTVQLLYWTRVEPGLKGRMTVALNLPRISDAFLQGFDLEWRENGDWHCVSAAKHAKPSKSGKPPPAVLEDKYLPAACRDVGPMPAATASSKPSASSATNAAPACPDDQDSITLPTGPACTPKCPAGKVRDSTNPVNCKDVVCAPDERKNGSGVCVKVGPPLDCGTTGDAHIAYSSDNTPQWLCFPKCETGQIRAPNNWFSCIPDPNAKPTAASTPPAAAVAPKPAAPVTPTPPAQVASIKCRTCTAGAEDVCELIHEEITCTAPNNYCITFVDNQDDGSKIVKRGCGNFQRVHDEWYQGTSDDDKCRERINVQQNLAFTCTFGCTTDNCNDNLRPSNDSLYQPK